MNNFKLLGLNKKVTSLAPMDGYTDCAFREIVSEYKKPDLMFTEFVNSQGFIRATKNLIDTFRYTENQRPIIAQIFGRDPKYFYKATKLLCTLGFDGVDINMGCPSRTVSSKGGGAGLIETPNLALEIIRACRSAIEEYRNDKISYLNKEEIIQEKINKWSIRIDKKREITLSSKTRIGIETDETETWIKALSDSSVDFLTLHGRTLKQMYKGKADWNIIDRATEISDKPLIGNGDIKNFNMLEDKLKETKCAGVMIGRGSVGQPWVFKDNESSIDRIKEAALKHSRLYAKFKGEKKFYAMRKILLSYFKGFENAKSIRKQLVKVDSVDDVEKIVTSI